MELTASPLGYGTGPFGPRMTKKEKLRLLDAALDSGIKHFDTAPMYGVGLAEAALGRFLPGRRDQVTVTTKVGLYPPPKVFRRLPGRVLRGPLGVSRGFDIRSVRASLEHSLKVLRTDCVDLLLLHEPTAAEVTDELVSFLDESVRRGLARAAGTAALPAETAIVCRRPSAFPAIVQVPLDLRIPAPEFHGRRLITHSTLSSLLFDPGPSGSWSNELGVDCSRPDVLAGLALAAARWLNPGGTTLFFSRREERIRANVAAVHEHAGEPARVARFVELVRASADSNALGEEVAELPAEDR